ncbi:MAG: CbtA family protein [Alphaproteobacteria bacterium]|jgi:cobalt transporter subunit CbtA
MIGRLLTAALVSGVLVGVLISVVHHFTTTPIILHAEHYEGTGGDEQAMVMWSDSVAGGQFYLAHGDEEHGDEVWAPENGLERTLFTSLANIITGVAFAALLMAGFYMRGDPVDGRKGVAWGVAGFVVFGLAPAMGLPPELPGTLAGSVEARQFWWAFAAISTGAGLWFLLLTHHIAMHAAGVLLIALPHIVGSPPTVLGGPVPPELAAHFVAASLGTGLIFWALLGWIGGKSYQRFVERPAEN